MPQDLMGLRETQELKVLQPQVLREHKVPKAPPEPKDQRALQHQHVMCILSVTSVLLMLLMPVAKVVTLGV